MGRAAGALAGGQHGGNAFFEPGTEDRIGQVGAGRVEILQPIMFRRRRPPQRLKLRKDEPHPMGAFVAGAELGEHAGVDGVLGGEEVGEHRTFIN